RRGASRRAPGGFTAARRPAPGARNARQKASPASAVSGAAGAIEPRRNACGMRARSGSRPAQSGWPRARTRAISRSAKGASKVARSVADRIPALTFSFRLEARSGQARAARFATPHGEVRTPSFMVVGTHAAVRALTPEQVRAAGTQVVLANTYHLLARAPLVEKMGGLHDFMRWSGPILTDSGGFQVFSLPKKQISDRGVRFQNEIDG